MIPQSALQAHPARGTASLWAGLLGAPVLWAAQMQMAYMLVPWCCRSGRHWPIHLTHVLFLALTLAGGWISFQQWRRLGKGWPAGSEAGETGRTRFLAMTGMISSGLFSLLILAQAIAGFFISPCWD